MVALSYSSAKNLAIFVVAGLVIGAFLIAKIMSGASRKTITMVVFVALAFGVWTQRQSLQRCADNVQQIQNGRQATCSFFGQEITVNSPASN